MIGKTEAGTWRVRVKFQGRIVASRTFKRRSEALTWEAEQKRLLQTDDWIDPKLAQEPLNSVIARWLAMREGSVSGRTYQTDESLLRLYVPAEILKRPIGSIRSADIEALYVAMHRQVSISSVSRFNGSISSLFGWAVRERIIRESPVRSAQMPVGTGTDDVAEVYPFTLGELHEVVAALRVAGGRWADLALVLGLTGIRWGELMALRCRDVLDLPYPAIKVSRSGPDNFEIRNTTKGGAARTVPLVDELLPVFKTWMQDRGPDELIFANSKGNRTGSGNWRRAVHWKEHRRGRRIHDLRHTAATSWLGNGIDPKTVQKWLGHASMTLTVDTYSHYMGADADLAAVKRMNVALGDVSGTVAKNGKQSR